MPAKKRRSHPGLIERLRAEPYRFEFFQAVRLLLAQFRRRSSAHEQDALGQVIRFRSSISLAFPPSEIESMEFDWHEKDAGEAPARFNGVTLTPSFIGLTGPMGVLPRHYTQHVAEREIYYRDTATRAFLDIFTTRAVALFYQSWVKSRLHLQYETDRKNKFLPMALSLAGLGLAGTRERLGNGANGIADESLAYYASALRQRPQSVQWFSRVIADYFRVHCNVEQFVGQWIRLPEQEVTRLGESNCALGQTSFCGDRMWDRQNKVRLTIGPMRKKQFDAFLPGSEACANLKQFFRLMVGATFDCEVRLILDKRDVAAAALGGAAGNVRLGWSGWMKSREVESDFADAAYLINA